MRDVGEMWAEWSDDETRLFRDAISNIDDSVSGAVEYDPWVSFLYHEAMWDFEIPADYRQGAYDAFVNYMDTEYGIDWDEVYDWEAYREAYDAA